MLNNEAIELQPLQPPQLAALESKRIDFKERIISLVKPALYHPRRLFEDLTLTQAVSFVSVLTFSLAGCVRQIFALKDIKAIIPDIANMITGIEPFSHSSSVMATTVLMAGSISTGLGISRALEKNGHKTFASLTFHASSVLGVLLATGYQWAAELSGVLVLGVQDEKDFIYGVAAILPSYLLLRNERNQPKS